MRFGPSLVKRCSQCDGYIEQQTMMSGNSMGARHWTDGKMKALMLQDTPCMVKCPYCSALLWLSDLDEVNQSRWPFSEKVLDKAKRFIRLEFSDYMTCLDLAKYDAEDERYLRMKAWWAGNDCRRHEETKTELAQSEVDNLKSLEPFLDLNHSYDKLMIAELKRELGLFKDSLKLLSYVDDEELFQAMSVIEHLAQSCNLHVAEIHFR